MNREQIKHMVDRFLCWKLPETFNPDGGVKFEKIANKGTSYEHRFEPSGTNLLDAQQATAMVQHMVEGVSFGDGLSFAQFSAANRERCEHPKGFNHPLVGWSLSDWMTATMGELGEAANVAKKLNRVRDGVPGNKQSPEELRQMFKREIGDVFVYLDLMAQREGFTLEEAALEVFNAKSAEIGYPNKL